MSRMMSMLVRRRPYLPLLGIIRQWPRSTLPRLQCSLLPSPPFPDHFNRTREPHVLLTTCTRPSVSSLTFIKELLGVLPCATYYRRGGFALKKIVEYAKNRDFSDLIVVNEDRKVVNGLLISHLPQGPTALFRLSNLRMPAKIKGSVPPNSLRPELVLNNFSTRLGLRVGRMLASLFHQDPAFRGRRVATFHNQRDFIFFRHHLYEFKQQSEEELKAQRALAKRRAKQGKAPLAEKSHVQARLREIGPRFTLRLQSLQAGTMDSLTGEYEWVQKKEQDTSRRRFQL